MDRETFISEARQLIRLHGADAAGMLAEKIFATEEPESSFVNKDVVIAVCCAYFNTSMDEMCKKLKYGHILYKRQVTIYLVKKRTRMSLKDIGHLFYRDHTSIISTIKRINELIATEGDVKDEVELLNSKI